MRCHIDAPSTRSHTLAGRLDTSSMPSKRGTGAPAARTASAYSASHVIQPVGVDGYGTFTTAPRPYACIEERVPRATSSPGSLGRVRVTRKGPFDSTYHHAERAGAGGSIRPDGGA